MKLITFASRWKKELLPDQVKRGKDLARHLIKDKNINDDIEWITAHNKNSEAISDTRDEVFKFRNQKKITKTFYDPLKEPLNTTLTRQEQENGKISLSDRGRGKLERLRAKRNSINSQASTNTFLGNAKKFLGKNKKSLIGAGVITLGAIGYGVSRKIRSDKNKKRGRYFK